MKAQAKRNKFTEIDDIKLIKAVKEKGKDWKIISTMIGNKTARQCRDRYNNYLSPFVQNKKWSIEEERILIEKYSLYGPKWSFLTRFFNNRAAVNIKNHCTKLFSRNIVQPILNDFDYDNEYEVILEQANEHEDERNDGYFECNPNDIDISELMYKLV